MPKLRLVKVLVQPVFVLDDGETITEIEHGSIAIPAAEWPTYSAERFPAEVEKWQAVIDAEYAPDEYPDAVPGSLIPPSACDAQ